MSRSFLCIFTLGLNLLLFNFRVLAHEASPQETQSNNRETTLKANIDPIGIENEENKQSEDSERNLIELFSPPGDSAPKDTEVGGTRDGGSCLADEPSVVALMPEENYGLTLKESPRVHLYLPKSSAKEALVTLQDEAGEYYETDLLPIQTNKKSNIASFALPDAVLPLQTNQRYQWFVTVICQDYVEPSDPTFNGWIKRVEPTAKIEQQLANKNYSERAQWYAKNSYWYDMLDSLPADSNLWKKIVEQINNSQL